MLYRLYCIPSSKRNHITNRDPAFRIGRSAFKVGYYSSFIVETNVYITNWKGPPCYSWDNSRTFDWAMASIASCKRLPEGMSNICLIMGVSKNGWFIYFMENSNRLFWGSPISGNHHRCPVLCVHNVLLL